MAESTRKPYSLYSRKGVFYARILNPKTGLYLPARSTGQKDPIEAAAVALSWLKVGMPPAAQSNEISRRPLEDKFTLDSIQSSIRRPSFSESDAQGVLDILMERGFIEFAFTKANPSAELLIDFLYRSWKEDGPYVQERRAYKHSIGLRHIQTVNSAIRNHWEPYFKGMRLGEVRRTDIKAFVIKLATVGLAPKTVNKVLSCGTAVLRWAANNDLIPKDPTKGVSRFADIQVRIRGVLTSQELHLLFSLPDPAWSLPRTPGRYYPPEKREKTAFAIAATTGLRLGEIVALRASDVEQDRIQVRHSWSEMDRLKLPKNGETRSIPILPEIRAMILALLETNPFHLGEDAFIFWGRYSDRPVDPKLLSLAFNRALAAIGIDDQKRKVRGLSFHSLRHGFAKAMADNLATAQAMKATGHKTRSMLSHYSDHASEEDVLAIAQAQKTAFLNIVTYKSA